MERTYIITNDRYSNQPDEVTFDQLVEMCSEMGWDVQLEERFGVDSQWPDAHVIYDHAAKNEQVVAVETNAYQQSLQ